MSGYVLLHRTVYDHAAFRNEIEASAFIWLFSHAAWRPKTVRYKGKRIELERGQIAISTRDLSTKFEWSEAKCRRYLTRLKGDAMIDARTDAGVNVITICNYDKYQPKLQDGDAPPDADGDAAATRQRRSSDAQNNKGNKGKEGNDLFSVPSERSADAPADLAKIIFGQCRAYLAAETQYSDAQVRRLLGKLRKDHSDGDIIDAVMAAQKNNAQDPIAYIRKILVKNDRHPSEEPEVEIERSGFNINYDLLARTRAAQEAKRAKQ